MLKLVALVCSVSFFGVSITAQVINTKNWKTFADTAFGVKAKYPESWELKTTNDKALAVFKSPVESDEDEFQENINIIARKLNVTTFKVKDALPSIIENLKTKIDSFTLLKSSSIVWNGNNAWELSYKGNYKVGNTVAVFYQRFSFKQGNFVTATYTAQGNKNDIYKTIALNIINTITF